MITVRIEGGQELERNLAQLSARLSERLQIDALKEAAEPMRKAMSVKAPWEPGKPDLRDMMNISAKLRGQMAVAVGPSRRGFYGSFQEFGTKHHAAQPFARPAFDETAMTALKLLSASLWRELAARGFSRRVDIDIPVMGEEV